MQITILIIKKLERKNLSLEEEKFFNAWVSHSQANKFTYLRIKTMKENGEDISDLCHLDSEVAWEEIIQKHETQKSTKIKSFNVRTIFKYAAVFIGVFGLGYAYYFKSTAEFNPKEGVVTLQFENGDIYTISNKENQIISDNEGNILGTKKDNQLEYLGRLEKQDLVYNTLSVPNGKRFSLRLSDNTLIYLNSGSSLKYPVQFLDGMQRKVFLSGEAYFEVTKDKRHPFIVSTGDMNIRVLGTKFNVTSYSSDSEINTVLVEGAVKLYEKKKVDNIDASILLTPGEQAIWDNSAEKFAVNKVDTKMYTEWMNGKLIFKKLRFKDIIKKLERHYNVTINNKYKELDNRMFTGTFDSETILEVLGVFNVETHFDYEILGNEIIIRKPDVSNRKKDAPVKKGVAF